MSATSQLGFWAVAVVDRRTAFVTDLRLENDRDAAHQLAWQLERQHPGCAVTVAATTSAGERGQ